MKTLHISVLNKIATYRGRDGDIVCGNNDYQIKFTFDKEWDGHETKVARFIWNGRYFDVEFTGDTCSVPMIQNTEKVEVGVYAGQLTTTTSATIGCKLSILCKAQAPNPGTGQHYSNEAKAAATSAKADANRAEAAADAAESLLSGTTKIEQTAGYADNKVMSQKTTTQFVANSKGIVGYFEKGKNPSCDFGSSALLDFSACESLIIKNISGSELRRYTVDEILTTAATCGAITVDESAKTIMGDSFSIVYDMDTNELKAYASYRCDHEDILLFHNHHGSIVKGAWCDLIITEKIKSLTATLTAEGEIWEE